MDDATPRTRTANRRMATARSTSTTRRASSGKSSRKDLEAQVSPARWGGVALVIAAIVAAVILAMVSPSEPSQAPAAAAAASSPTPSPTQLSGQKPVAQPRITNPISGKTTREIEFAVTVDVPEEEVPRKFLTLWILRGDDELGKTDQPKGGEKVTVDVRVDPGPNELTAVLSGPGGFGPPSEPVLLTVDRDAPELTITSPENKFDTYDATVLVEGTSEVGAKVRIRNKANGHKVSKTVGNSGTFDATVRLKRGVTNEIVASARDEAGIPREAKVRVDRLDGRPRVKIRGGPIDRSSLPAEVRIVVEVTDATGKPLKEAPVELALGGTGPATETETETVFTNASGRAVWKPTVEASSSADDALELAVTVTHPDSGETKRVPKTIEFR